MVFTNNNTNAMTYAPHQQRVIDEKNDLDDKAGKLSAFIGENPFFEKLDAAEQARMKTPKSPNPQAKNNMDTTKDSLPLPPVPCSVTAGGPPIDWKQRYDDLLKHVTILGAAASILRHDHKTTPHCEFPRTCGGCHFWTGVIEACRSLETGDKTTIRKAHAIVIGSQNASSADTARK